MPVRAPVVGDCSVVKFSLSEDESIGGIAGAPGKPSFLSLVLSQVQLGWMRGTEGGVAKQSLATRNEEKLGGI